ncbi:MAG: hypothetical protein GX126_10910, partial [Bacteroidales bacterium]|nr:hypothetical protein [Bacteroidales bacterium]
MANIIQLGSPFAAGQSPYDIFQDRMRTVAAIVENYKQWQEKKWDTEWQQAALSDIDKAKNQQTDILLQNINPPADKIDVEGATQFADKAMGMLQQKELMTGGLDLKQPDEAGMVQKKEIMTGGLESKSVVTATAPMKEEKPETATAQTGTVSKTIPDISEFNELMKFVQDLPTGEVNWDNTLSLFEQRLQKKRSLGDAATQFLNQILGQGVTDQRAKFEDDFNLAKDIRDTLYPETEQVDPIAQAWDRAGKLPQDMRADFLRQQGIDIPEGDKLDYDALNEFMKANNMKVKTSTVNDKGGQSFVLEPIQEEYDLNDIAKMIKNAEQSGIKLTYTKDGFSMSTTSTAGSKPSSDYERWLADPESFEKFKSIGKDSSTDTGKPPAYGTAQNIKEDLIANVETKEDYNNEINRLKALNIDTSSFSYKDIVKEKYNQAMQWVKYSFDMIGAGIEQDENYNYKQLYKDSWESAKKY